MMALAALMVCGLLLFPLSQAEGQRTVLAAAEAASRIGCRGSRFFGRQVGNVS